MKKIKLSFALLTIVSLAISQQRQKPIPVNNPKPSEIIAQSKLRTNQAGLPIEMAVLRYNDTVLLALQPSEVGATYIYFEPKNYDLKFLKDHGFALYFSKNVLKPEEVIELVSTYGFTLKDDILGKVLGLHAIEWKQQKLPPYLSFSIEEIKLK